MFFHYLTYIILISVVKDLYIQYIYIDIYVLYIYIQILIVELVGILFKNNFESNLKCFFSIFGRGKEQRTFAYMYSMKKDKWTAHLVPSLILSYNHMDKHFIE